MPLLKNYGRPPLTEEREQFQKLAAAGVPYGIIAKVLGVSRASVYHWRSEYCIPNRRPTKRYELRIRNLRAKIARLQTELAKLERLAEPQTLAVTEVQSVRVAAEGTK